MTGYLGKQTNWPDDVEAAVHLRNGNLNGAKIPGKIVSFNAPAQTATIQPLYKPKFNGQPVDMPELLEVPVRFIRAGEGR